MNEQTSKQTNKQANKQTNKHMNTHEKPWTPISTHEMKCIPVIVHVFSKTNLADKLLCVQLLDHCFHNFWFIILGVWSCIFFIQCFFLIVLYFISCFFSIPCWLGTHKNYPLPLLQNICRYILTHVFVQNGAPGSAVSPWLKIIFSEVPLHSQMPSYTKIWRRPRKIVCILFERWRHKLLPYCLEEDEPPPKKGNT